MLIELKGKLEYLGEGISEEGYYLDSFLPLDVYLKTDISKETLDRLYFILKLRQNDTFSIRVNTECPLIRHDSSPFNTLRFDHDFLEKSYDSDYEVVFNSYDLLTSVVRASYEKREGLPNKFADEVILETFNTFKRIQNED